MSSLSPLFWNTRRRSADKNDVISNARVYNLSGYQDHNIVFKSEI